MAGNWKELDLGSFKLSIPVNWNYKAVQGVDSFVGLIVGPKSSLSFNYSENGYANHLIATEQEYLQSNEWQESGYFHKTGVTYTADFNVENEKAAQMKKLGTTDSTLVHVEADPSYETKTTIHLPDSTEKIKFPTADYIAKLTYHDSTITVPIEIPEEVKSHNFRVDTTDNFIIKTLWPKVAGEGTTGVYMQSRKSHLNFNMTGRNLPLQEQQLALQTFRTIIIKYQ